LVARLVRGRFDRKSRKLYTPPQPPALNELHENFAKKFSTGKATNIALSYAEESIMICQAVSIQFRSVTDGWTDKQTELLYPYHMLA